MHRSCKVLLPYARTINNLKAFLSVSSTRYQEGLSGSKLKADTELHIDRPQTDNLLLTPTSSLLSEEKLENIETQQKPQKYHPSEIQNVENLTKPKILTEQRLTNPGSATIQWRPEADKQLAPRKTEHAVSFDEVPGPISLRLLSNVTKTLPVIGMQTISRLMLGINHLILSYGNIILMPRDIISPFMRLFDTYGDVVALRIPLCGDVVVVQKPEHISAIYQQKNLNKLSYSSFDSLTEWHKQQAKRRFDIGLGLTPEIKEIFKEKYEGKKLFWSTSKYHGSIEKTTNDFVDRLYTIRNVHNEVSRDFDRELYTWGIECMMQTLFGSNLGFYKVNDLQSNVEAQRTLQSFIEATDALQKCESGLQLWRMFNTRSWDKLSNACEVLESIMAKHIRMSKLRLDIAVKMLLENKEYKDSSQVIKSSLVKALILSGCVQPEQILTLCLDMMLLGVNASSTSLGFMLYHLSKFREKQERLFNEIIQVLPQKNSVLDLESLRDTPYLHACITESLRLKHPIPYSLMRLNQNLVINKYYIPAGTYVMTANEVACLNEENFDEPLKFRPERWLNDMAGPLQDAVIPLSEGTRSFLGRDWLHQQLAVATAKIIRHFKVDYMYGEIKTNRKILAKPTKPFKLVFEERCA